jgi:hypothetical protein
LASLVMDMCVEGLANIRSLDDFLAKPPTGSSVGFLLKNKNFYSMLYTQIFFTDPANISKATETMSIVFAELCAKLGSLKLVSIGQQPDTGINKNFLVSLIELRQMLNFISGISTSHPLGYTIKTNALLALRNLFKTDYIASSVLSSQDLLSKLGAFCKDGGNFMFHRVAWGFVFTLLQRHNVLDLLIEKNVITNLMDSFSVVSGNAVIQNSLHYLAKMLMLHSAELARLEAGKPIKRYGDKNALQTVEKDVKILCRYFIERRMFIKFQMICKRFVENADTTQNFPGAAFVELVRFYRAINEGSGCSKLKKDITRNDEYYRSFESIMKLVGTEYIVMVDNTGAVSLQEPSRSNKPSGKSWGMALNASQNRDGGGGGTGTGGLNTSGGGNNNNNNNAGGQAPRSPSADISSGSNPTSPQGRRVVGLTSLRKIRSKSKTPAVQPLPEDASPNGGGSGSSGGGGGGSPSLPQGASSPLSPTAEGRKGWKTTLSRFTPGKKKDG